MENNLNSHISKNIPGSILNMYKIPGLKEVVYEKYLKSREAFNREELESFDYEYSISRLKNNIISSKKDDIYALILESLNNDNIEIQRAGASFIYMTDKNTQQKLEKLVLNKVFSALNTSDIQIQRIGMNMIQFTPEKDQAELRFLTKNIIESGLNSEDIQIFRVVAKKINLAPEEYQEKLKELLYLKIKEKLSEKSIITQRIVATLIKYIPVSKQDELNRLVISKFEEAKRGGKSNEIVEPLLYLKTKMPNNSKLSREQFSKTGSKTTLFLGENLKNNLIMRHIETACFIAWKEAYENFEKWKSVGFDYVPIEPIYSFSKEKNTSLTNVVSGVLDLNLEEWYSFSCNLFKSDLDEKKKVIISTLESMGIEHGHPNNDNFCLRFNRNEDGTVDLDTVPRIYMIDFDKSFRK
ncbi:MAG: hypothetical protein R3B64_00895 [Candidatus Paceibacterota bacterium]